MASPELGASRPVDDPSDPLRLRYSPAMGRAIVRAAKVSLTLAVSFTLVGLVVLATPLFYLASVLAGFACACGIAVLHGRRPATHCSFCQRSVRDVAALIAAPSAS